MSPGVTIVAEGLAHPEGPTRLSDGAVAFVETYRERVSAWRPGQGIATFSDCGGAPNACACGTDGVYITQMGDGFGGWRPQRRLTPSIQRIAFDGTVTDIATTVDGRPLAAPNDLCFDAAGNLVFTDPDAFDPAKPRDGFVTALRPDGSTHFALNVGPVFPNGVAALSDGGLVWVESYTRRVMRRDRDGGIVVVATLPAGHMPDGLKATADGWLCVATIMSGGIDMVKLDGSDYRFVPTGGQPLNCLFVGEDLLITDEGEPQNMVTGQPGGGRLLRLALGRTGLVPYSGAIQKRTGVLQ